MTDPDQLPGASYKIIQPTKWPSQPKNLSVSTLLNLESCPRKWALQNADYPEIWEGHGYPSIPTIPELKGRIIHRTLETIIGQLQNSNSLSTDTPPLIKVMRELGGFSVLISNVSKEVLSSYQVNPRALSRMKYLTQGIDRLAAELRTQTQALLAQSRIERGAKRVVTKSPTVDRTVRPLSKGVYSEVCVADGAGKWKGFIDVLDISENHCEIRDYKSGKPKESDAFQVKTYAWLWYNDPIRNPNKRIADRLTLLYPNGPVTVSPLSDDNMQKFGKELNKRGHAACKEITDNTPAAKISSDGCRICNVRHLCEDYWRELAISSMLSFQCTERLDVQIHVKRRRGPKTWDAIAKISNDEDIAGNIIFYNSQLDLAYSDRENITLRILNALSDKSVSGEGGEVIQPLIFVTKHSEVFFV